MRRRPLVIVCILFILGIILGRLFHLPALPLLFVTTFLLTLSASAYYFSKAQKVATASRASILLTVLFLGALLYASSRLPVEKLYTKVESMKRVEGVVISYPTHGQTRTAFVLKPENEPGHLQVFYYHKHDPNPLQINYGDKLLLLGKFEVPWEFEDFNYREYLLIRDIWGVVSLFNRGQIRKLTSAEGNFILHWGYKAREYLFTVIDRYIAAPESGLLKALLFGERAYLGKDIEENFRDAGVMHVMAVSGMNIGVIIAIFWWLLRWFKLSTVRIYLIIAPVVLFYLLIVGFEVSLLRATAIFFFATLGMVASDLRLIVKKWADPFQGLSAAALIILAFKPQALFDVGFQLSFAATAAILVAISYFLPKIENLLKKDNLKDLSLALRIAFSLKRSVIIFLVVSLAAQLGVAPFIAYHFHRLYLFAILANLAVVPLATIAFWGGVFVLIIGAPHVPLLASYLGIPEGWLLKALNYITEFFAHLPFSYLKI